MADQVYQIDRAGNLSQCKVTVNREAPSEIENAEEAKRTVDNINVRQTKPSKLDDSGAASRVKDRTVYRIYFKAIGIKNLFVFVVFGLAFAFCIKFPGEYHWRFNLPKTTWADC